MSDQNRAIIFANGLIEGYEAVLDLIEKDDVIIGADGGSLHCLRLGLTPHFLIGDFDSLSEAELSHFAEKGARIIRHPARKDFTDLELALLHAKNLGATQIWVFGGLGLRWDQTLANLLLPASTELMDVNIRLVDGRQELIMLHSGRKLSIQGKSGDFVSLIPVSGDAHGVTTTGLEYPLDNETLYLGSTRSISNILIKTSGTVSLLQGSLLCVIIHQPRDN